MDHDRQSDRRRRLLLLRQCKKASLSASSVHWVFKIVQPSVFILLLLFGFRFNSRQYSFEAFVPQSLHTFFANKFLWFNNQFFDSFFYTASTIVNKLCNLTHIMSILYLEIYLSLSLMKKPQSCLSRCNILIIIINITSSLLCNACTTTEIRSYWIPGLINCYILHIYRIYSPRSKCKHPT